MKLKHNVSNEKIELSKDEYLALLDVYQKLSRFFGGREDKKKPLESLYGVWEGTTVNENDIEASKKSLFKTSL